MRNKLLAALTLCGVTAFSTSSWAGDWVKPTYKTVVPTLNQDTEGESYYIQHVATGKFLGAGNAYGTQLSVTDNGQKCVLTYGIDPIFGIASVDGIKNDKYKTGYENVKGWFIEMPNAPANSLFHYVFAENANGNSYVDMNQQGHCIWDIVKNENETYTIKIVAQDWVYGGPSQWNENGNANTMNGVWGRVPVKEGTDNNTVVNVFCDKEGNAEHAAAETEWAFVSVEEYEIVHGKIILIDALEAAEAAGFTDYAQWEAVLNQENVTLEECEKAVEELNKAVADYKLSLATPDKPIEVTELIKNASFGTNPKDNNTGWICTSNPVTGHQTRDDGEVGTTGRHIQGFAETWHAASNGGRNGWDIHQTITDLPIGKYRVYADMMGINQGDETAKPYGYWLYADGGGTPVQTEGGAAFDEATQKYLAGKGTENSVEVSCLRGSLTIGVKSEGTNCNWMTVDNFRMFYLGPDNTIFESELKGVIDAAEAALPATGWPVVAEENYGAGKAEIAKFDASLAAAKTVLGALASYTSDEILDATDDLKLRTDSLVAEMKAYTELNDYLLGDNAGINVYYNDPNYGALLNDESSENFKDFNDLEGEMYASLADGSYSAKDIAEVYDSLKVTFVSGVKLALKNGDTNVVTGLLANPGFDDNKNTGWSGTMDPNAGEGVPVAQFWGGRVNTFDQYQELTGLPEGSYTVTVQGLYRAFNSSSNVVNYTGAEAEKVSYSYLYANDAETRIMNMMEGAIADQPENAEGSWVQLVNATDEYANMWVPNDLRACNFHYAADRGNYLNSVICYVGADGVLRLGVRKTYSTTDYWTCVDNFTVTYLGKTAEGKIEAVKAAVQRGQNTVDNAVGHYYTDDADQALATAVTTANSLLVEGAEPTVEQCDEAIKAVDAAIEQFNKSMTLADEVFNWANTFDSEYSNGNYSDSYEDVATEVADVLDVFQRSSYATYDELNAEYIKLQSLFAKAKQDDLFAEAMKNATKEEPVDVTALITNPNMEVTDLATGNVTSSYEGWTLDYTKSEGTTNVNPTNFSMEVFNAENFRFYQTLYSLPAGTYRMTFQGFYRAGTSVGAGVARRDGKEKLNAFAYAALNGETKGYPGKEITSIFTEMTSRSVTDGMVTLSDTIFGEVKYIPNTMQSFHNICNLKEDAYLNDLYFGVPEGGADVTIGLGKDVRIAEDWCIFDTFKLYYLGEGAENDPVAVEGVEAETVPVSTTWYTVDGVQVNKPAHSGLYIRVQRMADGTTNTTKVMVK